MRNSKGPTIVVLTDVRDTPQLMISPPWPATRTRSTSIRKAFLNGTYSDHGCHHLQLLNLPHSEHLNLLLPTVIICGYLCYPSGMFVQSNSTGIANLS